MTVNEQEKNKLLENESIQLEKEHWEKEGEKFLNSKQYLNSLTVKKTEEK